MRRRIGSFLQVVWIAISPLVASYASAQTPVYKRRVTPRVNMGLTIDDTNAGDFDIILVTTGGAERIITLPNAVTQSERHYTIKKVDGPPTGTGAVKIVTSQTIDGQPEYFLTTKDQEVRVVSDGTNWRILDALPKEVLHAHTFPGADAGAKIAAACAALPATGGIIDARGFGATTQTISSDPFATCNKPVELLSSPATIFNLDNGTFTTNITINTGFRVRGGARFVGRAGGLTQGSNQEALFYGGVPYLTTGTMTSGSRLLTVASAANIGVGSVVGVLGAAGGTALQERPLDPIVHPGPNGLTAGATSLTVTGATFQGWMVAGFGSVQNGAAISCTFNVPPVTPCVGVLRIDTEFIGYTSVTYVPAANTTFNGLVRGIIGSTAATHAASAGVRQVLYHISEVESVSGTEVILKDASTVAVTSTEVATGPRDVEFDGIVIDGNVNKNVKSISRVAEVVTLDTHTPHGFSPAQTVYVAGVPCAVAACQGTNSFTGTFTILTAPNSTTITYLQDATPDLPDASSSAGFVARSTANINGITCMLCSRLRVRPGTRFVNIGFYGFIGAVWNSEIDGLYEVILGQHSVNLFGDSRHSRIKGTHRQVGAGPTIECRSEEADVWSGLCASDNIVEVDLIDSVYKDGWGVMVEDASNTSVTVGRMNSLQDVNWAYLVRGSDQWVTNPIVANNTAEFGPLDGRLDTDGLVVQVAANAANGNNSVDIDSPVSSSQLSVSPGNVVTWHDSTQQVLSSFMSGATQRHGGTLFVQNADLTVTGTQVDPGTTLIGSGTPAGGMTLPANYFSFVGKTAELVANGYFTTDATPGNVAFRVRIGGTTVTTYGPTAAVASADIPRSWAVRIAITCRVVGPSGQVAVNGLHWGESVPFGATSAASHVRTTTFPLNTTIAQAIDYTIQFTDPGNTQVSTHAVLRAAN